ncbi:S41 family peptidase [Chryseobacterium sp. Ch-15]|uniref:S41 family peptidase n=1 Tax=Chryseobacterium muglaense TaxID=2893752 RepID=A0A9Q3UY80_9FLAO|nr:S41 family peptidase [Chryseobacterium muglaense]MBD3903324.1 S41 family peptidase [Chryseobacterium muglaense]MCC9036153.1 S41 family peptidase [Chryseobacterium muglaense]MCM2553272.1 S41 family peptidase [Chryseobacterium muglaense]
MKKYIFSLLLLLSFTIQAQNNVELKKFTKADLIKDFDLAVNSLKEAHTGLYWYTTVPDYDRICSDQRTKITDGLNGLDLYRILAPIVSATKEGHCKISYSNELDDYFDKKGKYLPLFIKFFDNKPYVINNTDTVETKGLVLSKVNGHPFEEILEKIFPTISSDGFILTKKFKTLDGQDFSYYYNDVYEQTNIYTVELTDPSTDQTKSYSIASKSSSWMSKSWDDISSLLFDKKSIPSSLTFSDQNNTAILTYNTFRSDKYTDFHKTTDEYFNAILSNKVQNVIIDLRNNGGGDEGFEDYAFAYLTDRPYTKYKYVQASAFSYSFLKYSNKSSLEKQTALENSLKEEHFLDTDGRILRKPNILLPEKPKKNSFKGNLYVLIGGNTYSGGSEFASLIKEHRKATFIGEECGGGFYGNTSGFSIELILPNSQLRIKIPLLKFVLDTKNANIPFGHGVLPDYPVQPKYIDFLNGQDTELEFTKQLIKQK